MQRVLRMTKSIKLGNFTELCPKDLQVHVQILLRQYVPDLFTLHTDTDVQNILRDRLYSGSTAFTPQTGYLLYRLV